MAHNFLSPGAAGSKNISSLTPRSEKAQEAWTDLIIKMEALWLDVLEGDPDLYKKAQETLYQIRGLGPSSARESISLFRRLSDIIKSNIQTGVEGDSRLYLSRQNELVREAEYVSQEFDPDPTNKVPMAPVSGMDSWERDFMKTLEPEVILRHPDAQDDEVLTFTYTPGEEDYLPDPPEESPVEDEEDQVDADRYIPTPGEEDEEDTEDEEEDVGYEDEEDEVQESQSSAPYSHIMASLLHAAESDTQGMNYRFMLAGGSIGECMEKFTDVSSAHVEIGLAVPGSAPRLDVFVEWEGDRECYGYARLHLRPPYLEVSNADDSIVESIPMRGSGDARIAESIYKSLSILRDKHPSMSWGKDDVVSSLYSMADRMSRGGTASGRQIGEALYFLKSRVGLHPSVRVISDKIGVVSESDTYFYYSWELPYDRPKPADSEVNTSDPASKELTLGVSKDTKGDGALQDRYKEHWRTPSISVREDGVYLSYDGMEEIVERGTTDEDLSDRLASVAYRVDSIATGKIIEVSSPMEAP